jgi:hypothetical protein
MLMGKQLGKELVIQKKYLILKQKTPSVCEDVLR